MQTEEVVNDADMHAVKSSVNSVSKCSCK